MLANSYVKYGYAELTITHNSDFVITAGNVRGSTSRTGSGGGSQRSNLDWALWNGILAEIEAAAEGGSLSFSTQGERLIPAAILEAVYGRNITLILQIPSYGTVVINGRTMKPVDQGRIYYSPDELYKLCDAGSAGSGLDSNPDTSDSSRAGAAAVLLAVSAAAMLLVKKRPG